MTAWIFEGGTDARVLSVVDHASKRVPPEIELGIPDKLLDTHIAWDIGAAALARALGFPRFLGNISRLVVDFNREEGRPGLVPRESDGHPITGNHVEPGERLPYWLDYHDALAAQIARIRPGFLLSLHSFTPQLATKPEESRPWQVGVLYNQDNRAARVALPLLMAAGIVTGNQQPYSGKLLNATMNRHAEGNGIPYLGLEVRQDLISDQAGLDLWAERLRPVILACVEHLTC